MRALRSREVAETQRWEAEWVPEELKLLKHRFIEPEPLSGEHWLCIPEQPELPPGIAPEDSD